LGRGQRVGCEPAEWSTAALPGHHPRATLLRISCADHLTGGTRRHDSVVPPGRTKVHLTAGTGGQRAWSARVLAKECRISRTPREPAFPAPGPSRRFSPHGL